MVTWRTIRILLAMISIVVCADTETIVAEDATQAANERLKDDQEAVSGRFARFERLLSQMADMLGHEDPERAELLRRAISKGREQAIAPDLDAIARSLGEADYGTAREKQVGVTKSLQALLKLLQSEDRRSSVEKERERLNGILKDVRNAIAEERAARGAAQNSNAPSNAAPAQKKALSKTEKLLNDIEKHDKAQNEDDSEESESTEPAGESESESAGKSSPQAADSDKPKTPKADAESSNGDSLPQLSEQDPQQQEEGGPPSKSSSQQQDSKPQDSQGPEGQPQESAESPEEQTPGREQLEQAKEMMRQALEQLKEQEREAAVDAQDEAISELQEAAKQLEEMLKQLREEEKEMVLAALEARFQRMLAAQTQIYESTIDLAMTPRKDWLDNAVSQCRELGQQQADLTRECSQTAGLLREDGTSVSILLAVEDIEADMGSVAQRLRGTKVGSLTQTMESDVIESLEQLIEATQDEMEEMKSAERQQQQKSPQQSQKKPPLVEKMAEIRVLRSLQIRVNRRTKQVHALLQESETEDRGDLADQLDKLARRQTRLRESAVELGKQR